MAGKDGPPGEMDMEWLDRAACLHEDPELFFPVGSTGPALRDEQAAKRICARCPVISECLSWALRTGQTSGVWGGTGELERAKLRRLALGTRSRSRH